MTGDRTRLAVALLLSLLLHLLVAMAGWRTLGEEASAVTPIVKPPIEPTVRLGQQTPRQARLAWIPYEDFQRLIAPTPSPQEQPVTQRLVDPLPQAPLERDPTPPAPTPSPEAAPAQAASPLTVPTPAPAQAPAAITPASQPSATSSTAPTAVAAATPSPSTASRPTSAPRRPSESPMASPDHLPLRVRPGSTLTGEGVEVRTTVPRLSVATRLTAVPRNVVATLRFDGTGRVTHARLDRSTGYADVDGPITASLFEWTAAGERLADYPQGFTLEVELLLGGG